MYSYTPVDPNEYYTSATLSFKDSSGLVQTLALSGHHGWRQKDLVLATNFIEGWYSAPPIKVSAAPRKLGLGSHPVPDSNIKFAERVVTAHIIAFGDTRAEVVDQVNELNLFLGKDVRFSVMDGMCETFVQGYATVKWDSERYQDGMTGTLTIVTNGNPLRLGTARNQASLPVQPPDVGGLRYDSNQNIIWDLNWGEQGKAVRVRNLVNNGSYYAYPKIYVIGQFDEGLSIINNTTGQRLEYDGYMNGTYIFDSMTRTVTNRLQKSYEDMTFALKSRYFPVIPPRGSIQLAAEGFGVGTIDVVYHDSFL